ncbi:MAG TPA: zinc ribbon domain-containing protein [Dehalococcoidia bacterium]|nr:zinc ribbon domain-containing protein [Dehalococcoidia bacterium]
MPVYEFQCTPCREKLEVRQSISEDGSKLHYYKCDAQNPRRLLSAFYGQVLSTTEPSQISCLSCSTSTCKLPSMK